MGQSSKRESQPSGDSRIGHATRILVVGRQRPIQAPRSVTVPYMSCAPPPLFTPRRGKGRWVAVSVALVPARPSAGTTPFVVYTNPRAAVLPTLGIGRQPPQGSLVVVTTA